MKLYRILLLIVFICATLFIGAVNNISSLTRVQEVYWIAEASAWRTGGINNDRLHVNLKGKAQCTAGAHYSTLTVALKIDNKPNLDVTPPPEFIQHGSGCLLRNLRSPDETNGGSADVSSKGYYVPLSATLEAQAYESVGVMPPPPNPPGGSLPIDAM